MSHLPDEWSGEDSGDRARARDLTRITDESLESAIPAMVRQISQLQSAVALHVAEYDRRGLAETRHVLTTSQWLSHTCRITTAQATSILRTGRALEHMPTVSALATSGKITPQAVRKLTAAHDRHPEDFPHHESVLAEAATRLTPKQLRQAISYWEQQVAYPDVVTEIQSKHRRRRLSVNQTWDGMYAVSGELDPETGLVVSTALEASVARSALDPDDTRSRVQRMADSLADLCRFSLDHDHTLASSSGARPHITVTVDHVVFAAHREPSTAAGSDRAPTDQTHSPSHPVDPHPRRPMRLPELGGLPVEPETIRRLSCDAGIVRMVLDPSSEVIDVGRETRTIPAATRKALDHRDGGCTWLGCDAPPGWCDAHHIRHWADGGETNLANLRLLCRTHHTATHEGRAPTTTDPPDW